MEQEGFLSNYLFSAACSLESITQATEAHLCSNCEPVVYSGPSTGWNSRETFSLRKQVIEEGINVLKAIITSYHHFQESLPQHRATPRTEKFSSFKTP